MHYRTFRFAFSSVHRLNSPHFTPEENARLYGKCNNPNGHGHEYTVIVTVKSRHLGSSGMVATPREMRVIIEEHVAPYFDHADVNQTFGEGFISSGENLCAEVHRLLAPVLGERLHSVGLIETRKNSFATVQG